MDVQELNRQRIIEIFEASWNELAAEYIDKRPALSYLCEGDIQLHLASKLLSKMPLHVHINLPIPFQVKRFYAELEFLGRPLAPPKEHMKPDIVVTDENFYPCLISEIKFKPLSFGFIPSWILISRLEKGEKIEDTEKEELRELLTENISHLKRLRSAGPSKQAIDYFLSNTEKLIKVLKNFKSEEEIEVSGYLCVIDELFPDLEERLKTAVKEYDPPTQFEVLVEHFDLMESLEQIRKKVG